jgi:hypothetical protein
LYQSEEIEPQRIYQSSKNEGKIEKNELDVVSFKTGWQ